MQSLWTHSSSSSSLVAGLVLGTRWLRQLFSRLQLQRLINSNNSSSSFCSTRPLPFGLVPLRPLLAVCYPYPASQSITTCGSSNS